MRLLLTLDGYSGLAIEVPRNDAIQQQWNPAQSALYLPHCASIQRAYGPRLRKVLATW